MVKKNILIFFLFFLVFSSFLVFDSFSVYADYSDCSIYGNCQSVTNINLKNGKIWDNKTCTFISSPDGSTVQEICNA